MDQARVNKLYGLIFLLFAQGCFSIGALETLRFLNWYASFFFLSLIAELLSGNPWTYVITLGVVSFWAAGVLSILYAVALLRNDEQLMSLLGL